MPKKLTQEEFLAKVREKRGDKYNYSNTKYKNTNAKIIIICKKHGEFLQTPHAHLAGDGCPICAGLKKSTTTEFISKAKTTHGNHYDYSHVNYKNNHTKVIIVCPEHGKFSQTPSSHLTGRGCPKCGIKKMSLKITKTQEQFTTQSKLVHGNKYDYSKVKYINKNSKVIIVCPIHGEFLQQAHSHVNGCGCPTCSGNIKLTIEEFIKRANKVHKNKYNYKNFNYLGCEIKGKIICPIHGNFLQSPYYHINKKYGCPICEETRKKLTTKTFIKKARIIHKNKYNYSNVDYKNPVTKVVIICKKHGIFSQLPYSHLRGRGCANCKRSNGEKIIGELLDNKKIKYIKQKTFSDCMNPKTNHKLKYDFYLPKQNMLIEYNGGQHYINIDYWHKNGQTLEGQQYRDKIKKDYAINNGYKFLVIKYDQDIQSALLRELSKSSIFT